MIAAETELAVVILAWVAIVLMAASAVGILVFIYLYRPWNPRKHKRAGRHLLFMSWALLAVLVTEIVTALLPTPVLIDLGVVNVVLIGILIAVWQRVHLLLWVQQTNAPEDNQ